MENKSHNLQLLGDKFYRIKKKTGNDIYKAIPDAVVGEIMYDQNVNGICIGNKTSTPTSHGVSALLDIQGDQEIPYNSVSANFNGTSSYLTGAVSPGFDFSGNIALSLFFKPNQIAAQTLLTTVNYRLTATDGFLIDCSGNNIRLIGFNGSTQTFRDDNVATYTQGQWNHFALSFDIASEIISVYMNGTLSKQVPSTGVSMVDIGQGFYSGGSTVAGGTPTTQWLDGNMADITIFDKLLTASQIGFLYGNGLSNPKGLIDEFNPVQHLALDGYLYDHSVNKFHPTASNVIFSSEYPGI